MTRKELIDKVTALETCTEFISRAQVGEVTMHVCAELFTLEPIERIRICNQFYKSREASRRKAAKVKS